MLRALYVRDSQDRAAAFRRPRGSAAAAAAGGSSQWADDDFGLAVLEFEVRQRSARILTQRATADIVMPEGNEIVEKIASFLAIFSTILLF